MRIVDLSHPIVSGMPVYPGDPEVTVAPALTVASDGVAVARLDLGSHTGTHLDAPAHSIIGGATVDEIPLEMLSGEAAVLAIGPEPAEPCEVLGSERIEGQVPDRLPAIVLIASGWDAHFGLPLGVRHPSLALELVETLWERGARVLGVDMLSPDATALDMVLSEGSGSGAGSGSAEGEVEGEAPGPAKGEAQAKGESQGVADTFSMPVHELWLGRGGVIVENLAGLTELPPQLEVALLPLRITAGDGSPIRAVAFLDSHEDPDCDKLAMPR